VTGTSRSSLADSPKHRDAVDAVIEELVEHGPNLGRSLADRVEDSKFHNVKELRPTGPAKFYRVLFMFDPRRQAICCSAVTKKATGTAGTTKPSPKLTGSMRSIYKNS